MGEMNIDRRTFVGAMGALGALSLAGVGLGSQASAAIAADTAFPAPATGKPIEAKVDPKTATWLSMRTLSCATRVAWAATARVATA